MRAAVHRVFAFSPDPHWVTKPAWLGFSGLSGCCGRAPYRTRLRRILASSEGYRDSPSKSGTTIPHRMVSALSFRYTLLPTAGCDVIGSPGLRSA